MSSHKIQSTQIIQYIHEAARNEHPETVERLVKLVQQKYSLSEEDIMNIVCHAGLSFTGQSTSVSLDLRSYMFTKNVYWYWFVIAFCVLTATVVLIFPEINPLVHLRYLLGTVFVFWMPGYCVIKNLFLENGLEKLELIALSLGTSIMLVPMVAFVLHYTFWGITATSVTIILLTLTLALSTLAFVREHQNLSKSDLRSQDARTSF